MSEEHILINGKGKFMKFSVSQIENNICKVSKSYDKCVSVKASEKDFIEKVFSDNGIECKADAKITVSASFATAER